MNPENTSESSPRSYPDQSVWISGVGMTPFTKESRQTILDLMDEAARKAITDAGISPKALDSVHVGNMAAESFNGKTGLANALIGSLGAYGASGERIENTSASGSSALLSAVKTLESGRSKHALVVGVEKMSEIDTQTTSNIINRLTHEGEYAQGITLPSFAGLAAAEYLRRYEGGREELARVAVKNHRHGARNIFAQYQRRIEVSDLLESPLIAEPLRLFDCCPISDGAAAIVISTHNDGDLSIQITGISGTGGTHAVAEREDVLSIESATMATSDALDRANISIESIDVICLHDAFTILEWLELESMGFYPQGEAWRSTSGNGDQKLNHW